MSNQDGVSHHVKRLSTEVISGKMANEEAREPTEERAGVGQQRAGVSQQSKVPGWANREKGRVGPG